MSHGSMRLLACIILSLKPALFGGSECRIFLQNCIVSSLED